MPHLDDSKLPKYVALTGTTQSAPENVLTKLNSLPGTDSFSYTLALLTGTGYDATRVRIMHVLCEVDVRNGSENLESAEIRVDYPDGTSEVVLWSDIDVDGGKGSRIKIMIPIPVGEGQTTFNIDLINSAFAVDAQCRFTLKGVSLY